MNRLTKAQLSLETNQDKTKLGDKSKSVGEVRGGKVKTREERQILK